MSIRTLAVIVLTITPAVFQGRLSGRWESPDSRPPSAAIVDDIPRELGQWKYVTDGPELSDRVIAELGVHNYTHRIYERGDQQVTMLLMSGKTARMVRHPPEICYDSTGNTILQGPEVSELSVNGTQHSFLILPISPSNVAEDDYVVIYAFAANGRFSGTQQPRLTYHGQRYIQKLQVLCSVASPQQLTEMPEAAQDFITQLAEFTARHSSPSSAVPGFEQ